MGLCTPCTRCKVTHAPDINYAEQGHSKSSSAGHSACTACEGDKYLFVTQPGTLHNALPCQLSAGPASKQDLHHLPCLRTNCQCCPSGRLHMVQEHLECLLHYEQDASVESTLRFLSFACSNIGADTRLVAPAARKMRSWLCLVTTHVQDCRSSGYDCGYWCERSSVSMGLGFEWRYRCLRFSATS